MAGSALNSSNVTNRLNPGAKIIILAAIHIFSTIKIQPTSVPAPPIPNSINHSEILCLNYFFFKEN